MFNKTIRQISDGLAQGEFSSEEITKTLLEQIQKHNGTLNAYVTVTPEQAIASAQHADELRKKGQAGPLTGVPIAHKDIFCTKGVKTSCGSKMLDNFISPYDATVVTKLAEAGTVVLGKTNMDEFAMGSSNETSFYGNTLNPWHTDYVPGGSSGGSASAVAARLAPGATSTDTGGSIRQPAAFCGITGLKPTYGRVSRFGMIAFASSLDQGGPMAQTAEDCAMLLQAMAGHDPKDSTSVDHAVPDYTQDIKQPVKGLTIGVPKEFFGEGLPDTMATKVQDSIKEIEKLGATIKEVSLPNMHLAIPVYYVIAPAECSSNLARYDGVRYGHRCENPENLEDLYKRTRAEGFGDEVKRRILIGTYVLSAGYYDAYYLQAQKVRRLITNDFKKVFNEVDLLIGPTTPSAAFKCGEKTDDPISMYLSDIYTSSVNLAGLPGLSMPAGFINDLPVGVQLIGNHFAEGMLLRVAHQYQQVTDWHTQTPTTVA